MSFLYPSLLWLLALPVLLLAVESWRRRGPATAARPKIARLLAGPGRLQPLAPATAARTRPLRPLLTLGLACTVLAVARPQWGKLEEPVFDQAREVLIAIDLSRSMLADDVKPTRLERARLLTSSLLEKLNGERVGLLVFAGTAFLQSPLSADYEIMRELLPDLSPAFLPQGGSNYDALLETALGSFGDSAADRYLIILSDGAATDDNWRRHLPALTEKNIRVLSLGIGTGEGAMLTDGKGGLIKDNRGAVVLARLEDATLRELADKTAGRYTDAATWVDLAELLKTTVEQGRQGAFEDKRQVRLAERFQWALAPALLFFSLSLWREFPVRPRARALRLAGAGQPPPLPTPPPLPEAPAVR